MTLFGSLYHYHNILRNFLRIVFCVKVKVKANIAVPGANPTSELWDVTCRIRSQCYLPPDTSERTLPNPSYAGWYSIYLPWRDGRLSWPS